VSAVLIRNLITRPQLSDLFGKAGRRWMATLVLPADERHTLDGCLRQVDFLGEELAVIDSAIAEHVLASDDMRRLITIPGIDATTAATMMATIGRIQRFPTPRQLVGYVGLDARVRQSGTALHGTGGSPSKAPPPPVTCSSKPPGPRSRPPVHYTPFYRRIKARRGAQIAIVAVARKLTILTWHLLTKQQDYARQRPVLVARKLRRLELLAGAPPRRSDGPSHPNTASQDLRRARLAEARYTELTSNWQTRPLRA
jgi:transposase